MAFKASVVGAGVAGLEQILFSVTCEFLDGSHA